MAITQNTFTGNGSNLGPFSFTFKWLESTDIKVTVAGVLKTVGTHYNLQGLNYTTKSGGQVLFTAGNAPANGAAIVIYRQTDDADLVSTFYSGSAIRAQDLNDNFTQNLYVTQEANNNVVTSNTTANTALSTANTALSNSTAAVATANTASTNASNAVSTANTASSNASAAVATANTASGNASAAVATANTASSNATTAVNTANATAAQFAILDANVYDKTELDGGQLDNRYYTETELNSGALDSQYFRQDSSETINSGMAWSGSDSYIATTKAIDARIVDLVDDVGGFVPIANENSFPASNPDINNPDGSGTIVSIKEISSTRTPSSGTVTIANGSGSNTVTINGCGSTVLAAGFGVLVETTSTLHTYTFHRLVPKATEVTTVASISGDVTAVAANSANVTTVATNASSINSVAGNATNINAVNANSANINAVAGNALNINAVSANSVNINSVASNSANVNTVAGSIANVNTVASSIGSVNSFSNVYRIASSDPTTSLDIGDLVFNTTNKELRIYNGTAWQAGVTATGNLVSKSGDTMTGPLLIAPGTAALPGLSVSGDPNTGFWSPAADTIAASTGGLERLRIDSSGRLGLGVSSPAALLHVIGDTYIGNSLWAAKNAGNLQIAATQPHIYLRNKTAAVANDVLAKITVNSCESSGLYDDRNGAEIRFIATANAVNHQPTAITFATNDSASTNQLAERMRLDSSGRLGINTSSPDALLTVNGVGAHGLGSAAAPSFAFTGDLNTGIYSPGADQVAISTNSTRRLLIDSTGALTLDTGDATINNVRVGRGGGANISNTVLGNAALNANTTGNNSTALGFEALTTNTTGFGNAAAGYQALRNNTTGAYNTAIGVAALKNNTTGYTNTAIGQSALTNNTTGENNTCLGATAGVDLTTGSNNTIIGRINGTAGLSGTVIIGAGSTERLRIDSSGRLAVGNSSPQSLVHIGTTHSATDIPVPAGNFLVVRGGGYNNITTAGIQLSSGFGDAGRIGAFNIKTIGAGSGSTFTTDLAISTQGSFSGAEVERLRIDSSGRLLVGTSSAVATFNYAGADRTPRFQVVGDDINNGAAAIIRTGTAPSLFFGAGASGNNVSGSSTLSRIVFSGFHTDKYYTGAEILALVDNTPGASDMPSALVFSTTADGASSPTERLRITRDGIQCYRQSEPVTKTTAVTLTAAELKTGIIVHTISTNTNLTLPTGTDIEAAFAGMYNDMTFNVSIIAAGVGSSLVQDNTGITITGSATVANAGTFAIRRTAANTFIAYRIS